MKLGRLAGLERIELNEEKAELEKIIENLAKTMSHRDNMIILIKERLSSLVAKYGDNRRTEICQIDIKPEEKEIVNIEPEECFVTITETGLIKRIPIKSYRTQKRSGVGIKNGDDIVSFVCKTNTIDTLMIFTSNAKMYKLVVDNIPEGTNSSRGVAISSLIKLETNEKPIAYASLYRDSTAKFVFFVTKNGIIKKVPI